MNKFLSNVAAGVMSTVVIIIGTKIIYNELPEGTKNQLEEKTKRVYRATKDALKETMEPM